MSVNLLGQVWALNLPHQEMLMMLALADHGDRDGSGIYPSITRLCWMTGYARRHVQRLLRTLEEKNLIVPVGDGHGGSGKTTEYVMKVSNGVPKGPYPEREDRRKKGDILDTSPDIKGDILDTKGDILDMPPQNDERATFETTKGDILDTKGDILDMPPQNDERATFETTKGDILDTKGDILDTKGRHPDRPNRNRTIIEPEEEPTRARKPSPSKKNGMAEQTAEADPPQLRRAPPKPFDPFDGDRQFNIFAKAYRKQHGMGVNYSAIKRAFHEAQRHTEGVTADV